MDLNSKIYLGVIRLVRLALVIAFLFSIYQRDWINVFISVVTLFLTFVPYMFERRYKIDIPIEFEIVIVVFVFGSIFLGEVHSFYALFWWWDTILHTGSALAFGLIGFILMYTLYQGDKFRANSFMLVLFSFCFAVSIGALWEIFEFSMDKLFGFNMQKNGLVDTMWDLIVDVLGAVVASAVGYLYLKRGHAPLLGKPLNRFMRDNPRFFKKKKKVRNKVRDKLDLESGRQVRRNAGRKLKKKLEGKG